MPLLPDNEPTDCTREKLAKTLNVVEKSSLVINASKKHPIITFTMNIMDQLTTNKQFMH